MCLKTLLKIPKGLHVSIGVELAKMWEINCEDTRFSH